MALVPPIGMTCAWCRSADWMLGENAQAPGFDTPLANNYSEIFHDRGGEVAASLAVFDPSFFDFSYFETDFQPGAQNGKVPGACYRTAQAAGVVA